MRAKQTTTTSQYVPLAACSAIAVIGAMFFISKIQLASTNKYTACTCNALIFHKSKSLLYFFCIQYMHGANCYSIYCTMIIRRMLKCSEYQKNSTIFMSISVSSVQKHRHFFCLLGRQWNERRKKSLQIIVYKLFTVFTIRTKQTFQV